jgi:hypothetical protein
MRDEPAQHGDAARGQEGAEDFIDFHIHRGIVLLFFLLRSN